MATVSFKTDDEFKDKLNLLAEQKGINTSAYIKLVLTQEVNGEMSHLTENGLTIGEEMKILASDREDSVSGPFTNSRAFMKALKKK